MCRPDKWLAVALLAAVAAVAVAVDAPVRLFVANYADDTVRVFTADGAGEVAYSAADGLRGPYGAAALAFGPGGQLVVGNFDSGEVVRLPGGVALETVSALFDTPDALGFDEDGALWVASRYTHTLLRLSDTDEWSVIDGSPALGQPLALSIAGASVFVANSGGELFRYDRAAPLREYIGTYGSPGNVAIAATADGRTVYHLARGVLRRVDTATGAATVVATLPRGVDEGLALAPPSSGWDDLYASDYAGAIYRVNRLTGAWAVFADRDDGLAGPSGLAFSQPDACAGYLTCDANCDGTIDTADIDAFVMALTNPNLYATTYPACSWLCNNDANGDGSVDTADIDAFVDCVVGGYR